MLKPNENNILRGDFSVCQVENKDSVIHQRLFDLGFTLVFNMATHIDGGQIDQVWTRMIDQSMVLEVKLVLSTKLYLRAP